MHDRRSIRWQQFALALGLAALFTLAWAWRDRANLSALRLPDTDDAMRLQQWRDWLGGQGFADLAQHRLATQDFGGLAMHWSRLPDLVPGGLIALLAPLVGQAQAELVAVIAWPALLFAAALWLTMRIARLMLAPAGTALIVAALAFPASALFLPGRIDHHGLQLVLLLALVLAMLSPRGAGSGAGVGAAAVAALTVGMETAPFAALACALVVLGWAAEREGAQRQLASLAATLATGGLLAAALFAPAAWSFPACDGFTVQVWRALLVGAAGLGVLALAGHRVAGRGPRLLLAGATGGLVLVAVQLVAPACADPYGGVDPALAARWLANVGEAQSLFAAPAAVVVGQCGLMFAGLAAGGFALWRTRDPGWAILLLFQGLAAAIAVVQLRGAWAGALLAAPALAWTIAHARTRGVVALAGAWLAAAGIVYPLAGEALFPTPPAAGAPSCASPAELAALDRLPPGRVAGPIDLGAWGIAATRHRFLAAPYHRNNAGNAAAFAILDGPAARSRAELSRWRIDYLAVCGPPPRWLRQRPPGWLRPVARAGELTVFAIDRLPARPAPL